ncbi:MAG: hypothetical protein GX776_04650 [Oxalobacter sp.]|nr:hypothetical protein [Oxalobacter sp.]
MLSSTYVQVAMQLENDRLREDLSRLKRWAEDFCESGKYQQEALEKLLLLAYPLHSQCCLRRLEVHFLPEMQKQVPESSRLIADHEVLHQSSANLHAAVCLSLYQVLKEGGNASAVSKALVEQYCQTMFQLLEIEERLIFPLAQENIPRESWFSLARIFMREQTDEISRHVVIDLDDDHLEKYCPLSINGRDEKADSGLKYNLSDNSGLQGLELSSLHVGSGQLPPSNLTRIHGKPVVQQALLQNS